MSYLLEYDSNNSGGSFWLTTENWKAMEAAGWNVKWPSATRTWPTCPTSATIEARDMDDAKRIVREWEFLTHQNAADEGCNCCGQPHNFSLTDIHGKYVGDVVNVWSQRGWS